jgi:predicted ribosome quality control (RQC) complex YloA/Tae2 family protein
MRYPLLSFLELQHLSKLLDPALRGAQIDRIFIPECLEHPQGFFKNEIVFEFRHSQLLVSIRSQACGLAFLSRKGLRPAKNSTRSAFDLSLGKEVEGLRIDSVSAVPGDRMMKIILPGYQLFLNLLPAIPEGVLVSTEGKVIASSKPRDEFSIPPPREMTPEIMAKVPNRPDLINSLEHYSKLWMDARTQEALTLRRQKLISHLDQQLQALQRKIKSLEQQTEKAKNDPDWRYFGTLLQTHMHAKPLLKNKHYSLMDYEKNEEILIPGDEKLNHKQQLEKYFHQAKRNKTRLEEGTRRIEALQEKFSTLHKNLSILRGPSEVTLATILKIEELTYLSPTAPDRDTSKKLASYAGKTYRSQEGFTILSGRSKDENLELTFKVAKGNDLWLHVKGRPGSHTIILLPPKKTASLDTLLDAANLCILHSGGKEWGKTEVDYTQRKHVKKIKNQTEVTYSGNKTLIVSVEPARIKRLYGDENG